ncbi:MAG: endolytic transglycosylase MltG [Ruminococcus sp.]
MSDNLNNQREDMHSEEEVQLYRQRRVDEFKLRIDDSTVGTEEKDKVDFTGEISSFSDETTRAQIERESKKTLRREEKEEKTITKIKSGRNKKIYRLTWLCLIIVMSIVLSQFLIIGCNDFLAINRKNSENAVVRIAKGDSIDDIADKLLEKEIIDSTTFFVLFANITGKADDIEPGIYQVPRDKDYLGILNYLQNTTNRQNTITLQISEGTNVLELSQQLYDAGVTYDVDEFLRLCNSDEFDESYSFLKNIEKNDDRIYKLEGYLFPDTYEFYADEAPDITIKRFLNNFEAKVYESEYEVEGYDNPVAISTLVHDSGYTLDEIIIMSSIVQGESADSEDMYNVASVIDNRLKYGSQYDIHSLGMDSTAFYPYKNAQAVPKEIRETFEGTYDTYEAGGFPPGAICNPGAEAIIAAACPNDTDYLYFCHGQNSDGSVTPYYAVSFEEHMSNLSKAGLS